MICKQQQLTSTAIEAARGIRLECPPSLISFLLRVALIVETCDSRASINWKVENTTNNCMVGNYFHILIKNTKTLVDYSDVWYLYPLQIITVFNTLLTC